MFMAKRRKRKSSREAAPEHELPGGFWRQVGAVVLLALAVVLVMTWFGSGGTVLNSIHAGASYAIGYATYFIPILLVYLAVMIFRAEGNRLPIATWIASFLMVAWLSGIFGIPTFGEANPTGGVVGEGLNTLATQILDKGVVVFIYAVLIFLTGIFILAISPASVFRWILNLFKSTRKAEDQENASIARRANAEASVGKIPVRGGISAAVAEADKENRKLNISRPKAEEKPAAKEPERALVTASDPNWKMPSTDLLSKKTNPPDGGNIQQNAAIIRQTYEQFGINVEIDGANVGPRVTQYTLKPPAGINLSKITARDKELAMNLAVDKIRIEAPIPGTNLVGVELPNARSEGVTLRSLLESDAWKKADKPLTFIVGKDISGAPVVANLAKMPHLLIAGTTGSGKSVMTNILISSLLYRNAPSDLKLIIVDPKQVEMVQYNDIPHLLTPIINSTDKALSAMKWAVNEMERRYSQMAEEHVKNIEDYNAKIASKAAAVKDEDGNEQQQEGAKMPYIVVIIDEMADLMMQAGKDLEQPIVRIAQKGRAAGMHLVLATQRPVVKVITGLIKSNVPGRIAFAVNNNQDSRIMLDMGGAEKLLGAGDMLMLTTEMMGKPRRIQGAFASDAEIERLTNFLREQRAPEYNDEVISQAVSVGPAGGGSIGDLGRKYDPNDPIVRKAVELSIQKGKFSTAMLQTYLGKGHGFVSGLAIWFEEIGIIGPANGNKPRDVLISSLDEFDELVNG
jgi:S-DNA-T family DNA segregation ATPase FtsK/SpoIIIE